MLSSNSLLFDSLKGDNFSLEKIVMQSYGSNYIWQSLLAIKLLLHGEIPVYFRL